MACACEGANCPSADAKAGARAQAAFRLIVARFIISSVLFALAIIFSFVPDDILEFRIILIRLLFILSWLASGYRVVLNALQGILRGRVFDENFLMTIATVGAFIIGQWSEGAAVMLFYNLGEMVQESAVSRSRRSISDLMDVRPDFARLAQALNGESEVHPSRVAVGERILVKPGEKVPLDGIVLEGSSSFDTSRLTGESVPRFAETGSEALAGFVNGSGVLIIRTVRPYAESAAARMLALIEDSRDRKARSEKLITAFARIYTPIVTISALFLAVVPPLLFALSWEVWVGRALVFLVISCPCAFVIAVPLGFFGGIGGAARKGILIKGADFMDVLANASVVVFDKTGTLTTGVFTVRSIQTASGFTESEVLSFAARVERHSSHPVASAVLRYAESEGVDYQSLSLEEDTDYTDRAGYGVSVNCGGRLILAGSQKLMEENGVPAIPPARTKGGTTVYIALDGKWIGTLTLNDVEKPDARQAVTELYALGITEVVMLTGDSEAAAREMADRIGIADVRFGILPHEKVSIFEEIANRVHRPHKKKTVLFVGDGINDAPVLSRADAGIAMGGIGSDAAIEAADVVLMNDNPLSVVTAIRTARWTRHIVVENIVFSFVVKIGFLVLGAMGVATLWEAVFADVGVALLATVNSLRARR